ncbi:MAG: cyclodeaminase/cyclohydrolase family protein, partial [Oscillospiraceae bacterium]
SDTETQKTEKEHAIQHALTRACAVPLEIMDMCGSAVECAEAAAQTGSRLAVSDAGCAALCASAALECAALNVFINTRIMTDREAAKLADARANELLAKYRPLAGGVVESVRSQLTKPAFTKEQ